jgi:hypothetical protein
MAILAVVNVTARVVIGWRRCIPSQSTQRYPVLEVVDCHGLGGGNAIVSGGDAELTIRLVAPCHLATLIRTAERGVDLLAGG